MSEHLHVYYIGCVITLLAHAWPARVCESQTAQQGAWQTVLQVVKLFEATGNQQCKRTLLVSLRYFSTE